MSKADYLRDAYRHILASLLVYEEPQGQGELSLFPPEEEGAESIPLTLEEDGKTKRVVMPTQNYLRQGDWDNFLAFHPLCEHVMRGESETIKVAKRLVNFRLRTVFSDLLLQILWIASNDEKHKELAPGQSKFIQPFSEADEKTVKALNKLLDRHSQEMVNIYLKPFGELNDRQYRRLACVAFRLYEELQSEGSKCMDVNMGSKKGKRHIVEAMEAILPGIDDQHNYYVGSNADVAPNFDALMRCYAKIAKQLNKVIQKFRKHLANPEQLKTQLDWVEYLDELPHYKDALPSLPGNTGAAIRGEEQAEEKPAAQRLTGSQAPKVSRDSQFQQAAQTMVQQPAETTPVATQTGGEPHRPVQPSTQPQQPVPSGGAPTPTQPAPVAAHSGSQQQSAGEISWSEYKARMGIGQQPRQAYNPYAPPQAPGRGGMAQGNMPMNTGQQGWGFQPPAQSWQGQGWNQPQPNPPAPGGQYSTSL